MGHESFAQGLKRVRIVGVRSIDVLAMVVYAIVVGIKWSENERERHAEASGLVSHVYILTIGGSAVRKGSERGTMVPAATTKPVHKIRANTLADEFPNVSAHVMKSEFVS
jgi:hypothetical protein